MVPASLPQYVILRLMPAARAGLTLFRYSASQLAWSSVTSLSPCVRVVLMPTRAPPSAGKSVATLKGLVVSMVYDAPGP